MAKQIGKKERKALAKKREQEEQQFQDARMEFWDLRNRLFLQEYTLTFQRKKPKSKNTAAQIFVSNTRSVARLQLGDYFFTANAEERRHYVVHELLHITTARLDYLISDVRSQVSPQVYNIWYTAIHRELERLIDSLADIIAPQTLREDERRSEQEKREAEQKSKRDS